MRRILVLGVAVILSGCAFQMAEDAHQAQRQMVGMPKARVLACMGAPDAKAESDGVEVWTYRGTAHKVSESFDLYCRVDVTLDRDKVSHVNYSGPTGGPFSPDSSCYYTVGNCL